MYLLTGAGQTSQSRSTPHPPPPTTHGFPFPLGYLPLPCTSQIWASAWGPPPSLGDSVFVLLILRLLLSCFTPFACLLHPRWLTEELRGSLGVTLVGHSQLPVLLQFQVSSLLIFPNWPPNQVSPFSIEPSSCQVQPLGECRVDITLEALHCQHLQTVLELEVVNGAWR